MENFEFDITGVFPVPVVFGKMERNFTDEEMLFALSQEKRSNSGNDTSVNSYVLNSPEFSDIKLIIEKYCQTFLEKIYTPKNDLSIYLTQSWFNYSNPGQWHHKHYHLNSFISGVLYLSAKTDEDKIFFHRELVSTGYDIPTENFNTFNSQEWWFPIETGQIILFPSSLVHSVKTVDADQTRISLAFNTFIKGALGSEQSLTSLIIS